MLSHVEKEIVIRIVISSGPVLSSLYPSGVHGRLTSLFRCSNILCSIILRYKASAYRSSILQLYQSLSEFLRNGLPKESQHFGIAQLNGIRFPGWAQLMGAFEDLLMEKSACIRLFR